MHEHKTMMDTFVNTNKHKRMMDTFVNTNKVILLNFCNKNKSLELLSIITHYWLEVIDFL